MIIDKTNLGVDPPLRDGMYALEDGDCLKVSCTKGHLSEELKAYGNKTKFLAVSWNTLKTEATICRGEPEVQNA